MLKGTLHCYVILLNKGCDTFSDNTESNRDLLPCVFPRMAPVHRTASISDWFIPLFTASFVTTLVI